MSIGELAVLACEIEFDEVDSFLQKPVLPSLSEQPVEDRAIKVTIAVCGSLNHKPQSMAVGNSPSHPVACAHDCLIDTREPISDLPAAISGFPAS